MNDASGRDGEPVRRLAHPLTFGGVAAFAIRPGWWLLMCAAAVALVTAAFSFSLFFHAWGPALETAAHYFPSQVQLRASTLTWEGSESLILADNTFLALVLHAGAQPLSSQTADLQIEFSRKSARFSALFGYVEIDYPVGWSFSLGRADAIPLWRTWRPYLGCGFALAGFSFAMLLWAGLSSILAPLVRAYAVSLGRGVSLAAAYRVAWGALLPGALVLNLSVLLYTLKRFSLVEMLLAAGVHLVVDLLYLLLSPWRIPRQVVPSSLPVGVGNKLGQNPFGDKSPPQTPSSKSDNPFNP
jgi:hypothetical protein